MLEAVGATLSQATSLRATTKTISRHNPRSFEPSALAGTNSTVGPATEETAEIRYMRPNYVWQDVVPPSEAGSTKPPTHNVNVCTPTSTVVSQWGSAFSYTYHDQYRCHREGDVAFTGFFEPASERLVFLSPLDTTGKTWAPMLRSLTYSGKEAWNGTTYDVVQAVYGTAYQQPQDTVVVTRRFYISPERTIRRIVTSDNWGSTSDEQVLTLQLSGPMTANDFVWTPPAGVTVRAIPTQPPNRMIGQQFPTLDVAGKFLDGRNMTLRQALNGKKGAVVWYWATNCGGCIVEFPHLEQLYRVARDKGIEVIALDPMTGEAKSDSVEENHAGLMRDFWGTTLPIVLSNKVAHGLTDNSANYMIIDATGKVVDASVSMDFLDMRRSVDALAEGRPVRPAHD